MHASLLSKTFYVVIGESWEKVMLVAIFKTGAADQFNEFSNLEEEEIDKNWEHCYMYIYIYYIYIFRFGISI